MGHEDDAAILSTVPDGDDLVLITSFVIDFVDSMDNLQPYREVLTPNDMRGTYFIQTKYFREYADQGFFNDKTIDAPLPASRASSVRETPGTHRSLATYALTVFCFKR